MLVQVPTITTKISETDLTASLIRSWHLLYGVIPAKESICVILSQWALETGEANCYNYNIGNVKAADETRQTIEYCALNGVWEIENGVKVSIPATNPGAWFRAFDTLDLGTAFYLNLLKTSRYASSWQAILNGSPTEFAQLLKNAGYYTAPETTYAAGLQEYFNKFMADNTYQTVAQSLQQISTSPTSNTATTNITPIPIVSIPPATIPIVNPSPPDADPTSPSQSNFFETLKRIFLFFYPFISKFLTVPKSNGK